MSKYQKHGAIFEIIFEGVADGVLEGALESVDSKKVQSNIGHDR